MQSRCNSTHISDGYEIGRSVTASEIFVGTWERDVTVRLNKSQLLRAPPSWRRGVLRVNCQMQHLSLICYWASVIEPRSLTGPEQFPLHFTLF